MRGRDALLIAAFAGSACSSAPLLTDRGYGAVRFGDPIETAESALGAKARTQAGDGDCAYASFSDYPGISFMVESGKIVRADVSDPARVRNSLGIAVGAAWTDVLKRYPAAQVQPHQYDPAGHYLLFLSPDGRRAFVFEESGGRISGFRSGLAEAARYVEGCL